MPSRQPAVQPAWDGLQPLPGGARQAARVTFSKLLQLRLAATGRPAVWRTNRILPPEHDADATLAGKNVG
jgi:hypothetical protein